MSISTTIKKYGLTKAFDICKPFLMRKLQEAAKTERAACLPRLCGNIRILSSKP